MIKRLLQLFLELLIVLKFLIVKFRLDSFYPNAWQFSQVFLLNSVNYFLNTMKVIGLFEAAPNVVYVKFSIPIK